MHTFLIYMKMKVANDVLFLLCVLLLKLLNGTRCSVPLEVALMAKVNATAKGPSGVVNLLDWYDLPDELILVLERPVPCLDLVDYLHSCTSSVQEQKAKVSLLVSFPVFVCQHVQAQRAPQP